MGAPPTIYAPRMAPVTIEASQPTIEDTPVLAWARRLANATARRIVSDGIAQPGEPLPRIFIGNPNPGGWEASECAGIIVAISLGPVWQTTDPWPTGRFDTDPGTVRTGSIGAAEFTVSVLTCVPGRDESMDPPPKAEVERSAVEVTQLQWALWNGLWCANSIEDPNHEPIAGTDEPSLLPWKNKAGLGRIHVDRVTPLAREGTRAGWSARVVAPVCWNCA